MGRVKTVVRHMGRNTQVAVLLTIMKKAVNMSVPVPNKMKSGDKNLQSPDLCAAWSGRDIPSLVECTPVERPATELAKAEAGCLLHAASPELPASGPGRESAAALTCS